MTEREKEAENPEAQKEAENPEAQEGERRMDEEHVRLLEMELDLDVETGRSTDELLSDLRQLIHEGRNQMDELADSLGLSAVDTERLVRAAEMRGDVTRDGYSGLWMYTVRLTEQGADRLPEMTERDKRLAEYGLAERDLKVLAAIKNLDSECTMIEIREEMNQPPRPVELIPVITHLVREGYLEESGLLRRRVELTRQGEVTLWEVEEEE